MNREELLAIAKPILFNTEMVRAILDGRKTQTRRVIKNIPDNYTELQGIVTSTTGCQKIVGSYMIGLGCSCAYVKPQYQVGDILYVRETFSPHATTDSYIDDVKFYVYRADFNDDVIRILRGEWKPSIHMPKQAARIFLKVTDVRVERLQEINEYDAQAEGAEGVETSWLPTYIKNFAELWDSTLTAPNKFMSSPYRWERNPWVFVYEFERMVAE